MSELRYTLAPDGPTDRALVPILSWLLQQHNVTCAIQSEVADPLRLPRRPPPVRLPPLAWRIRQALELFPCDVLFVHRDAEREPRENRLNEIEIARQALQETLNIPLIPVIPVRMQEAWLLIDETAIRVASGNPNGRMPITLPRLHTLEHLNDPKEDLRRLLHEASGLRGRRYREVSAYRVAEFIEPENFALLRALPAFQALEESVELAVQQYDWHRW